MDNHKDSEIINQFNWRYKKIGEQWSNWKTTPTFDHGPQNLILGSLNENKMVTIFKLLITKKEEYSS